MIEQHETFALRNHWSEREIARLQRCRICLIGVGAVGSFAAEALVRAGVERLTLVDGDRFEASNLNRQLYALHSTLGMSKVEVTQKRLLDINPGAVIDTKQVFLNRENIDSFFEQWCRESEESGDELIVIDAIDRLDDKCALLDIALQRQVTIFSSMGAARKTRLDLIGVAKLFETSVCPLARRVRQYLRRRGHQKGPVVVYSTEPARALRQDEESETPVMTSLVTVTASFGLQLAHLVLMHIVD